jgi:hypothetical protein
MKTCNVTLAVCALAVAGAVVGGATLGGATMNGPMRFDPIDGSAAVGSLPLDRPFKIPDGYRQIILTDEIGVDPLDIYPGVPDWPDMTTTNESRIHANRYMYRTHEVRPSVFGGVPAFMRAGGGAVSVVDLLTGEARVLAQRSDWEALDGLVWTPWHTLLFAEETIDAEIPDPHHPAATSGLLYEIDLASNDPMTAQRVAARPRLGSLAHEGIETDPDGNVYVIDEFASGAIYRFVPEAYGDLSRGLLYALRLTQNVGDKTGPAEWVPLDMNQAQISARVAAAAVNATTYGRPEDIERIGNTLYVAITSENRVLSIGLGNTPAVKNFVKAGVNVPTEAAGATGFRAIDNLANGPDGRLWLCEDNLPSDIWVAEPDNNGDGYADGVHLFASLSTPGAEATGIYFGRDPHTLLVNVQHAADGNDKTMAITNR